MKNTQYFIVRAVTLLFVSLLSAETQLVGDIGGRVLEMSGNPYIVNQDVFIAKNKQAVFKAGTVVLFNSFCGLNVYGSVFVEGTSNNPVVFSSINDTTYYSKSEQLPNPFDWNGIYILEESNESKFRNFKLLYSTFGIKSKKDDIVIQNGYFKQNGQFHFTINDNIQYVTDNMSYSYPKVQEPTTEQPGGGGKIVAPPPAVSPARGSTMSSGRKVAAVTFLSGGLVFGGACIYSLYKTNYYSDMRASVRQAIDNQNGNLDELDVKYAEYGRKYNQFVSYSQITGASAGVCLAVSLYLFVSNPKSQSVQKLVLGADPFSREVSTTLVCLF